MKTLFERILRRMDEGKPTVLASVIETTGSTPRKAGAHMLVDESGLIWGTIGGGPGEGMALKFSARCLTEGKGCIEHFVLRDDSPEGIGSVCGGELTVSFLVISPEDTSIREASLLAYEHLGAGKPCTLVLGPMGSGSLAICAGRTIAGDVPEALQSGLINEPRLCREKNGFWFTQGLLAPGKVYIFGGGHVAQALVPALAAVGFRCVILEDRPEFCSKDLFPAAEETRLISMADWEKVLEVTPSDYVCIMTRGHVKDLECMAGALRTPARYIGVIGSRRKIAFTNARLREQGFTEADISRLVTPIGIPIDAETPAEIAVSITAQMIQVRARSSVASAHAPGVHS